MLLHINASRYKLRICLIYVYSLIVSLVLTLLFVTERGGDTDVSQRYSHDEEQKSK